jgi:hypothetical protein
MIAIIVKQRKPWISISQELERPEYILWSLLDTGQDTE